ncbi:MAG TPA: hypothetical protein VJW75_00870 [Candidatus Eisenbacteria bacterium]|nr:hypothetical protein [Candidatus Eisenbacteria bacterium]
MKRTIAGSLALAVALLGSSMPSLAQDYGRDYGRDNRGWGDRNYGSMMLEGRWIARRGYSLPSIFSRPGRPREVALPPRMVIDQRRNVITVENFNGRVLQEIVVGGRGGYRGATVYGQWRDSKLVTVRDGYANTRIIQTFSVRNRGRTLVVYTRQDGPGTRNDVEFTNIYQKA